MNYSKMIKEGIKSSGKSLMEIFLEAHREGIKLSPSYLSLLQNGKTKPANDEVNRFLAKTLGLDEKELLIAAYKEKVPKDVLEELAKRTLTTK